MEVFESKLFNLLYFGSERPESRIIKKTDLHSANLFVIQLLSLSRKHGNKIAMHNKGEFLMREI